MMLHERFVGSGKCETVVEKCEVRSMKGEVRQGKRDVIKMLRKAQYIKVE